ncbi:MAG: hypothetical protein KDJ75_04380 [Alphaproteobacteria bacterium]|nr:hypothetical protein [Alphaproteobacteria bacterium]
MFNDPSVQTWAGVSALNLLITQDLFEAIGGGGLLTFNKFVDRKKLSQYFGETALGVKCIDTRPDNTMCSNFEKYELAVDCMKSYHSSLVRSQAATLALMTGAFSLLSPHAALDIFAGQSTILSGCLVSNISGHKRFKNIEDDVWRIVDWPEPKKAEEKEPLLSEQLALVPAPIRE